MVRRQKNMKGPDIKVLINIDFLEFRPVDVFREGGGVSERNVNGTFLVTKSICEFFLSVV